MTDSSARQCSKGFRFPSKGKGIANTARHTKCVVICLSVLLTDEGCKEVQKTHINSQRSLYKGRQSRKGNQRPPDPEGRLPWLLLRIDAAPCMPPFIRESQKPLQWVVSRKHQIEQHRKYTARVLVYEIFVLVVHIWAYILNSNSYVFLFLSYVFLLQGVVKPKERYVLTDLMSCTDSWHPRSQAIIHAIK